MRALLFGILVLAMVAAGCSGDDDDTTSDATSTTTAASATAGPPVTEAATSTTTVRTLEEVPIHQLGESVEMYRGILTITSIEADPVSAPDPAPPDGERYVLVRGTVDYTGPEDEPPGWPGRFGWETSLNAVGNTDPEEEHEGGESECRKAIPDVEASHRAVLEETMAIAWCYSVPADESSWMLYLPSLLLAAYGGKTLPDMMWELSL